LALGKVEVDVVSLMSFVWPFIDEMMRLNPAAHGYPLLASIRIGIHS